MSHGHLAVVSQGAFVCPERPTSSEDLLMEGVTAMSTFQSDEHGDAC